MRMAADGAYLFEFRNSIIPYSDLLCREAAYAMIIEVDSIRSCHYLRVALKNVIQRISEGVFLMKGSNIGIQLRAQQVKTLGLCAEVQGSSPAGDIYSVPQLLQYCGFSGLVGMQLQAEWAKADCFQPVLNDVERCHFFGDEQYLLSAI